MSVSSNWRPHAARRAHHCQKLTVRVLVAYSSFKWFNKLILIDQACAYSSAGYLHWVPSQFVSFTSVEGHYSFDDGPMSVVGWLFNGTRTSTQKGQFVPTVGEGNRLSRLIRMANNEIQCILPYVTQFTVKHSSYMNATTGYLIE